MSAVVFPIHDPQGILFHHLWKILPILKENFSQAFISITPLTQHSQEAEVKKLREDPFFSVIFNSPGSQIGDHFIELYRQVVSSCLPDTTLHLVTEDRLSFILETNFKEKALHDFKEAEKQSLPVLFHRSQKAWETHPKNYLALDSMVTRVGEVLFGKTLDFVWCHVVLKTGVLKEVLPKIESHDLVVFAELIFHLKDKIQTKDVDWLAWEDPFVFAKDPIQYQLEREKSGEENNKRLGYVLPSVKMLLQKSQI